MTQKTRDNLKRAAQIAALLVPALGGAWTIARAVGATKLDVVVYTSDRRADSLTHYYEQRAVNSAILRTDSTLTDIKADLRCLRTRGCQ